MSPVFAQEKTEDKDSIPNPCNEPVEVGYGQRLPACMINSSLSTVKGETLEKTFSSNLHNSLPGRLSGLTVTQGSDEPGVVNNTLRSRGLATYTGSNDMLLLVDGFGSSFSELVPEEIESITLLKDAAATAIYGLRGANGVLLVTTKRGIEQPLQISFSSRIGFHLVTRKPGYPDAYSYATLYNEGSVNDGTGIKYSEDALNKYRDGSDPYLYPDVDWYKEITRKTAPVYNIDLNFRGGNKIARYFVLLNVIGDYSLLKNSGGKSDMSINNSYTRYNIRSNIDLNITQRLSAAATVGVSIADRKTPHSEYASSLFEYVGRVPANAFPVYNPNGTWGGNNNFTNPVGNLLQTGYYTTNSRTVNATLKLTEQLDFITPGLSASVAVSFNNWYLGSSDKHKRYAYYNLLGQDQDGEYVYDARLGEDTSLSADENNTVSWRNSNILATLDYDRSWGRHRFNGMLMYQYESYHQGDEEPFYHIGGGGRFIYVYDQRYIAEITAGYQGSENFRTGKQYGFFPAGSIGWVISNENFLKGNKTLSFLKLRASYGLSGNDNTGGRRYMYDDEYAIIGGYTFGSGSVIWGNGLSSIGNPDVTWEKERKLNTGVEATFLKSLDISFDYFNDRRRDILTAPGRNIPVYFGTLLPLLNIGETKNSGFEATVRYSDNLNKEFNYFVRVSGWYAKNKIVCHSESLKMNDYQYTTGRQINQPFYLIADGFYSRADLSNPDVAKPDWLSEDKLKPGDIKYMDQNKDGVIDSNDYYPVGNTDFPALTLGLTIGFEYKNFDFNAFFHGAGKRDVYLGSSYYRAFQGNGTVTAAASGRWTPETADQATYPRLSVEENQNNFVGSTFWLKDGSFIKLRSVELGYTFKNFPDAGGKSNLRLFVSGNNLFSIDHVKDCDPELLSGYPSVRTLSLGAKIHF
jgi:TonB-linked SusC/RagA family outer membrane protein